MKELENNLEKLHWQFKGVNPTLIEELLNGKIKSCIICNYFHYAKGLCELHWSRADRANKRGEKHPEEPFVRGEYLIYRQGLPGTQEGRVLEFIKGYYVHARLDNGEEVVLPKDSFYKIDTPFEEIPLSTTNLKTY